MILKLEKSIAVFWPSENLSKLQYHENGARP